MRQAMPGVVVLLVATHAAHAVSYRIVSTATACIDPRTTLALGASGPASRHPAAWRTANERQGHCIAVEPGARWERIVGTGPLMLLRRVPPVPGLPPLWFRADALIPDADDAVVASTGAPAASTAPGSQTDRITTEPLPAPAAPSSATDPHPATPSETAPMPASQSDTDASLMAVTTNSANLEKAMQQGYVVGFVAAMLLIVLMLCIMAGIIWAILRNARVTRDAEVSGFGPLAAPALAGAARMLPSPRHMTASGDRRLADPAPAAPDEPAAVIASPEPAPTPVAADGLRSRCLAQLDAAGWQAGVHADAGQDVADLVARRDGRILALRCLPAEPAVDEDAIDGACLARERRQADLAAIVSNAPFTAAAKLLAAQTGVVLLHEDEMTAFVA